jgi:gliding motility-associated-like protein
VTQNVVIERPQPGISYPVQYAIVDLPIPLKARQFGDEVLWIPGTGLDSSTSYTPVFKGASEQLYTIKIETSSGCITIDTQMVKTVKNVEVYVPTAFTPNRDGKNDYLRPILMGVKEMRFFRIFNRWGQLLFETKAERPGWSGTFKDVTQETQTVVWMVEVVGVDGNTYVRKGTSILLR